MKAIALTQFMQPKGNKEIVFARVPDEVAEMAERQVLTCECTNPSGPIGMCQNVILYSHSKEVVPDEGNGYPEYIEHASNGPGDKSPEKMVEKLIRRVDAAIESGEALKELDEGG